MRKPTRNREVRGLYEIRRSNRSWRFRSDRDPDVTLEEWQRAFESFKSFPYPSIESRLSDLGIVQIKGSITLGCHEMWEDALALNEWVLQDDDLLSNLNHEEAFFAYQAALYCRSADLISLRREQEAFDVFLRDSSRVMTDAKRRKWALLNGSAVFTTLRWREQDETLPAPPHVVEFIRKLFKACYPRRKTPVPLQSHNDGRTYSWIDLQRVMNEQLDRPPCLP